MQSFDHGVRRFSAAGASPHKLRFTREYSAAYIPMAEAQGLYAAFGKKGFQ